MAAAANRSLHLLRSHTKALNPLLSQTLGFSTGTSSKVHRENHKHLVSLTPPPKSPKEAKTTERIDHHADRKALTTKICIVMRFFKRPFSDDKLRGLPPYTRKIGLPDSRVLYTVLRSPFIDKKSREQFQMEIKKELLVIHTGQDEMRKKFFWLKGQRIFGAQYETIFSCKTRLDKEKLQRVLSGQVGQPERQGL